MQSAKILIVEDENIIALDLKARLIHLGYSICGIVVSGELAVQQAEALGPDVVLMDIVLKGTLDGVQTAEIIRTRLDIPIIFVSSFSDSETINRAKATNPFGYILKPFEERELIVHIEMALYAHKMDQALRLSEQKYRSIIQSSKDGIMMLNQLGIVVEWNTGLEQITGVSATQVLGKDIQSVEKLLGISETWAWSGLQRIQRFWKNAFGSDNTLPLQTHQRYEIKRMDGVLRNVELTIFPIDAEEGVMIGSICRDITEESRAEEALSAEKERLAITLHSIGDGVITTDTNQQIVLFNPVAEQLTGWTYADVLGKSLSEVFHLVHDKDHQAVPNPAEMVLQTGNTIGLATDTLLVARDGSERLVSSSIAPIRGSQNEITGVVLVFRDVTSLRRAEEALRDSQEYARNLIDCSLDMIIAVNNQRKIVEFNRAAQRTFGYAPEEIIGKHVSILYANPDEGVLTRQMAFADGGATHEVINRRKDGHTFPSFVSAATLRNAEGQVVGAMGISRDITLVKQAEQQTLRAERLAALGRMAAALAHEINNPLQAIRSTLDLVIDYPLEPDERDTSLRVIRQEIDRLSQVTKRVLQFARPSSAPRRITSLSDLLNQTLSLVSKHLQHSHIQLMSEMNEMDSVLISPEQFSQVFLNIMLNAIDAVGEGGKLAIRLCRENDQAVVYFENNGPSIPTEEMAHIFEPFFTTKSDGSGLGLSISHGIVRQHGGTITAENISDQRGVRFTIRLPFAPSTLAGE
jgi:two-component system NtrC family sensor kinase